MRQEDGTRDIGMIKDIFFVYDVERILRIPCSRNVGEYKWCWIDDEKGVYTVKTGYKRLMGVMNQPINQVQFNWQKLWNMRIPPKVKNFVWRVFFNCLPTLDNF